MARALGVRTELDSVLSVVAPLGLAAAATTATLLVDLDPKGPDYPSERSLAELVADGPTLFELSPSPGSIAVLRNGGVEWSQAVGTIERLARAWSALVLRVPDGAVGLPWPVIPVVPLLPGILSVARDRPAVWQRSEHGQVAPGPGPLLPPLTRGVAKALLELRLLPTGRWVKAWRAIWGLPWPRT